MSDLLKKNHVKYGLIMSGIVALCLLLIEVTGQNESFDQSPFTHFFTFIAPFVVWYYGIRARKIAQKGKLTFKEGVKEGFKISVVYGLVSPLVFVAYYLLVNPEILQYVREAYNLQGADDSKVIFVDMVAQVVAAIVFGTLYGAIISFFLKTKPGKASAKKKK